MILKLDRVNKAYERSGVRFKALQEVTLNLFSEEFVGLMGPAGAGKTTLLRVAAGLEVPDEGRVIYGGHPLDNCSRAEIRLLRRRYTGCVFGTESLHPGLSVFDNVAVRTLSQGGRHDNINWHIHGTLRRCGLDHRLEALPDDLGNGERIRLAIAQAVVNMPQLLLVDEPTVDLDLFQQRAVLTLLKSLVEDVGVGVLITGSEPTDLASVDRLHYIRDGLMVQSDSLERLNEKLNTFHDRMADDA